MIFQRISIGVFLLYAAIIIHAGFYTPIAFDNYYFATIAKNIAWGYGWVDSYHENTWFVAMTSGPLVLIPGAIFIRIFGNEMWVLGFASAISNLIWASIFLYLLSRYLKDMKIFLMVVTGALFIFLYYESFWWTIFSGEMPAFLLFLIGAVIALDQRVTEQKKYVLLGLVAGLSIYAKMMALPGFGAIAFYLVFQKLRVEGFSKITFVKLLKMAGLGLAGIIFILLPFRIYEAFSLYRAGVSLGDFWTYKKALYDASSSLEFLHLSLVDNPVAVLSKNFTVGMSSIYSHMAQYGIPSGFFAAIFIFNMVSMGFCFWLKKNPLDYLIALLGLSFLFFMVYFLFLAQGIFIRYGVNSLTLFFLLMMLSAIRWLSWKGLIIVVIVLLSMLPSWRLKAMGQMLSFQPVYLDEKGDNIKLNRLTQEVNHYIKQHDFTYPLASCGWMGAARSVLYLQDETKGLKDANILIEQALQFDEADYFARYPEVVFLVKEGVFVSAEAHYRANQETHQGRYRWREPVNFTLVIDNINWRFGKLNTAIRILQNDVLSSCRKTVLYESEFFRIMECPFSEIQKHIDLDGTTPFARVPRYGLIGHVSEYGLGTGN